MNIDDLIYGKNKLDRIVSIESGNGKAEVFRELEDGTIESTFVPCSHYILYSQKYSDKFQTLKGDQFYKYLMEYNDVERYRDVLSSSYNKRYPLHVVRDPKEALMVKDGYTYFKGMKVSDVSVLSIDIEDTFGIGETLRKDGLILLIGNTFRKQGKVIKKQFAYDDYPSQEAMLNDWSTWVKKMNPSVITGWNLYGHDLRVIDAAARNANLILGLGRDGSPMKINNRSSQFRKDGSQAYDYNNILIYGREIVDGWFLAMKYDVAARREYENYKLKDVIAHEKLEKKNRQHYDGALIPKNFRIPEEWKKIKAYNVDDADDPLAYFDLTVPSFFYYTQSIPRSLQSVINTATGSQINSLMVRGYLQQGHSIALASEAAPYKGAISFGVPGIHKNVFKIDVQSLYPSIILSERICNREKDPQELFIKIVEFFTEERIRNKETFESLADRYYSDLSDSQKIVINSMYGAMGAGKINYNYPAGAARVTEIGREILKKAILWASGTEYVSPLEDTNDVA